MVFYQVSLLLGYLYAHWLGSRFPLRTQVKIHALTLGIPFLSLPLGIPEGWVPPVGNDPTVWMLGLMAVAIGFPFFAVSATGPLLQKWFSLTQDKQAKDPYFLYAASNVGSLVALLGYPFLIEPAMRLQSQSIMWSGAFAIGALFILGSGILASKQQEPERIKKDNDSGKRESRFQKLKWTLLAFTPSSLMMSATTFLSNEVAAVPLLWIVPLSLYLLTFIMVFARKRLLPEPIVSKTVPIAAIALVMLMATNATEPFLLLVIVHLTTFFILAYGCHARLADSRPKTDQLTEYYLYMSIGGALGGVFNALIAPVFFNSVLEYPLAIALAVFLIQFKNNGRKHGKELLAPIAIAVLALGSIHIVRLTVGVTPHAAAIAFLLPVLATYFLSKAPVSFSVAILSILVISDNHPVSKEQRLLRERSFFGIHTVTLDPEQGITRLYHGRTVHGIESARAQGVPSTYYHPSGPVAAFFGSLPEDSALNVAVIGLGAGSTAAYANPTDHWTYFEIDPSVVQIAESPEFFSFLKNSKAPYQIKLGDARIRFKNEKENSFDLIMIDAFSSDVVPAHLITKEAFLLYRQKLKANGSILINVSNRHLRIDLIAAASGANAGFKNYEFIDELINNEQEAEGKASSHWMIFHPQDTETRLDPSVWKSVSIESDSKFFWTDDFHNIIRILK